VPEGDTIFRAAATLHRALAGKPILRFESMYPAVTRVHDDHPLTATHVEKVSSSGKHILIHFANGFVLRTHMRMNGSWHIYRPGERWQRPAREMRLLIANADFEAVAFSVPVAEMIKTAALAKHRPIATLGPDLLGDRFDREEAIRRLRAHPDWPVADALLNQRIAAGVGNVYKAEVLFSCRINPFVTVAALSDEQVACLIDTGRQMLLANVSSRLPPMTTYTGFRRTTRRDDPSARLWVYGRARRPCRRCGTPIEIRKHGTDARLTYWCPQCQAS
jgi:endonuclease VIII